MKRAYYVGMDIHKHKIAYCEKTKGGKLISEGVISSNERSVREWATGLRKPWIGAMESTLFSGYVYDVLLQYAKELKVANPLLLKAFEKHKNDRIDARKLCDLLRVDVLPECYIAAKEIRELRRVLRYRNMIVREASRFKNRTAGLLMEVGVEYNKSKLHGKRYFNELVEGLTEIPESVKDLLWFSRSSIETFDSCQKRLVKALGEHDLLRERIHILCSIGGVGIITSLTWALEVADPFRFPRINQAISYCGLCSAQKQSGDKSMRGPVSKQRNKHLQWALIECAKLAPALNPQLRAVHERALKKGNRNRATLAVARKLVGYLLAVDKSGKEFVPGVVS